MDEVDCMIDFGFEELVNKIFDVFLVINEKLDMDEVEDVQMMKRYLGGRDCYR